MKIHVFFIKIASGSSYKTLKLWEFGDYFHEAFNICENLFYPINTEWVWYLNTQKHKHTQLTHIVAYQQKFNKYVTFDKMVVTTNEME